ncbi:putative non-specific serine/threonine protein kinase [Rosa chinensis]|uniref:Putative non-specific serine/threonine protein kinase n=1 Tax=Rosa chinensis TaxID=74649 RepID=A0A2P6SH95_ROSCH|nr:putative non-specific serine/threonine protein kinase [Rosa chinensis]
MDGRCLVQVLFNAFVVLLVLHTNPSLGLHSGVAHPDTSMKIMTKCIATERQALLAIKQDLMDYNGSLSSWGSEALQEDCCKWKGVSCSNQSGHVIKLDLAEQMLRGKLSPKLIMLQHLEYLDLSDNNFGSGPIPRFIGSLSRLRYLDLSGTSISCQIPYHLGNLTHLQNLKLHFNYGSTPAQNLNWLPHLSSLTHLTINSLNLSNAFDWLETVNKLPKLKVLALRRCLLPPIDQSSSLPHINSKTLGRIDLSFNYLNSSIFPWLFKTSLVYLDLISNHLTGSIPDVFQTMSSLVHLDLSFNQLEGSIPHSFAQLCSLQFLALSGNNLES